MSPTRELAIQVAEEIGKLRTFQRDSFIAYLWRTRYCRSKFAALKKNPQIIIGTPGRLLDHINRKTIKLE